MDKNSTGTAMVTLVPGAPPSFVRITPAAAFLSQLIAERDHLAPQRSHERAPLETAVGAYDAGSRMAVRRLPPGYRTRRDA